MHPRLLALVTIAVCHVMWGRSAIADTQQIHGVIAVGGSAEERDRAAVTAGVIAATRGAGWQLPGKPLTKKETAGLLRCLDPGEPWECIPGTINAQGINHALVVAAEKRQAEDGSPLVVLNAKLIVTRPHALVINSRFCEHCTDDKLTQTSSELTQQLVQELAVRIGRTVLEVKSTPTGARVTLDGAPIGATDQTFNTYPGSHIVIIEKPGYFTQNVSVQAEEGKTATVAVILQDSAPKLESSPTSLSTKAKTSPEPSRLVPLTLFGAGGVGLATAGVLVYLGQQDGPNDKTVHRRATTLGILSGVAGAAAIGAGLYLWWRGSTASAPTISTIPGGAIVGWTRTF